MINTVANKKEEALTYGDSVEMKKAGPGEWRGDNKDFSTRIKLLKDGIELTKKPKDGSWEQKILFDKEGKLHSEEITSPLLKKPLTMNVADENRKGKELSSALETLRDICGLNYNNLECTITDPQTKNSILLRPYGNIGEDRDKIGILQGEGITTKIISQGEQVNAEVKRYRKYNISDFSLYSVYFNVPPFEIDTDVLVVHHETSLMRKFLSQPEVKEEAERMKLMQR